MSFNPFAAMFDVEGFPRRWSCGSWSDALGYTHIVSDLTIFGAYVAIPILLMFVLVGRRSIPFPKILLLFAAFILACGTVHLIEAIIFYYPIYRFSAVIKVVTALVSVATVVALAPVLPQLFRMRTPAEWEKLLREKETAVRQAEQAMASLDASERHFRGVFNQAFQFVVLATPDGIVLDVNQTLLRFSNTNAESVVAGLFLESCWWCDTESHANRLAEEFRRAASGQLSQFETEIQDAAGNRIAVDCSLKPVFDSTGEKVAAVMCEIRDVSRLKETEDELRRLNQELEQRNRDLDEFVNVASHDMKAPLRGIKNLASWISDDAESILPEQSKTHLSKMQGRIVRMESLLDDLLEFSRIGRTDLEASEVDVATLTAEIVEMLAPPTSHPVAIADSLPAFVTARTPLQQVLRNLIGNSLKHHGKTTGEINIWCEDAGDFYRFYVADDGIGIAPEFHERVFEMFQSLQSKDDHEGSGMGLAIIRRIVETYGGAVCLKSQPNEGAEFSFTWPKQLVSATT